MRRTAILSATGILVAAALLGAAPAWAAPSTEVVQGEVLRLVSVADWDAASRLLPGQSIEWDVSVSAEAPEPGFVSIGVSATGDVPLSIDVSFCAERWQPTGCPGGTTMLRSSWDIPRDGAEFPLVQITDAETAHLRLVVTLGAAGSGSTDIRVHARGAGESAVVGPGGGMLATTGLPSSGPWILGGGAVLVVLGLLLGARRRRHGSARAEQADDGGGL